MTDAFPNYFSGNLTSSAANTFTTSVITLPINRIGRVSGTKATVLEFLWVDLHFQVIDLIANGDQLEFALSTPPAFGSMPDFAESNVIAFYSVENAFTTSGMALMSTKRINLQSADGHGTLVASENINVNLLTAGQAAATRVSFRVYYRFVQIPALEMMGILQSQV